MAGEFGEVCKRAMCPNWNLISGGVFEKVGYTRRFFFLLGW